MTDALEDPAPVHQEFTLRLPDGTEQGVALEHYDRDYARGQIAALYPDATIDPDPEPEEGTNS